MWLIVLLSLVYLAGFIYTYRYMRREISDAHTWGNIIAALIISIVWPIGLSIMRIAMGDLPKPPKWL